MEKAKVYDTVAAPEGAEGINEVIDLQEMKKQMHELEMYCSLLPKKRWAFFSSKNKGEEFIHSSFKRVKKINPSLTMKSIGKEEFLLHRSFKDKSDVSYTFFGKGMRTGKSYLLIEPKEGVSMLIEKDGDHMRFFCDDVCVFDLSSIGKKEQEGDISYELDMTKAEVVATHAQKLYGALTIQSGKEETVAQEMMRRDDLYAGRIDKFLEDEEFTEYVKEEINRRYLEKVPFGEANHRESLERKLYDKMKTAFLSQWSQGIGRGGSSAFFVVYAIQKPKKGEGIPRVSPEDLEKIIKSGYPRSHLAATIAAPLVRLDKGNHLAIQVRVKESDGKVVDYAVVYNKQNIGNIGD